MPLLNWIDDSLLVDAVSQVLGIAQNAEEQAMKNFHKNVIDPFSALFQMAGFGLDYEQWVKTEQTRQSQKTLQNHVGNFHQIILGYVKSWDNLRTGNVMDLLSDERKILAEIKNKHNTVKKSDLAGLYKSMESAVMAKSSRYKGYTAYYVTIIPQKPERFDLPFTPSDKETGSRLPLNENIRWIDGASFYHLATGEPNALQQLFDCLPEVISRCARKSVSKEDAEKVKAFYRSAFG